MIVSIDVDVDDIIDEIRTEQQAIEIIEKLDDRMCSWDLTGKLLVKLLNIFQNDFVENDNPEGSLSPEEKELIIKANIIIKKQFEGKK